MTDVTGVGGWVGGALSRKTGGGQFPVGPVGIVREEQELQLPESGKIAVICLTVTYIPPLCLTFCTVRPSLLFTEVTFFSFMVSFVSVFVSPLLLVLSTLS